MRENLARIKKIALAILAYSLLVGLYGFVTSSIVRDEFYINLYMPSINILPMWEFFDSNLILLVLIILVIEESFSIGLKLQKDKDLTIEHKINLDLQMAKRKMSLTELAEKLGLLWLIYLF